MNGWSAWSPACPLRTWAPLPDGGRLAYRVEGCGDPVLLLRPLGGSIALWGDFARALAREHTVVAFDPRGVGRSSLPPWGTGTRSMARDALALLDHLTMPSVAVFGISLGGMVATWLAADAPARVNALVLASTLPRGLWAAPWALHSAAGMARCLTRGAPAAEACLVCHVLSPRFRKKHPDAVADIRAAVLSEPATRRGLMALLGAAAAHDGRRAARSIRAPTLVLAGEADALARVDRQRELAATVHGAAFELLPGAGHDLTLEQPGRTRARVSAFLMRCDQGANQGAIGE